MLAVSRADDFRLACMLESVTELDPDAAGAIAGVGGQAANSRVRQWLRRHEVPLAQLVAMAECAIQNCKGAGPTLAKHLAQIELRLPDYGDVRKLVETTPPLRRIFLDPRVAETNFFPAMQLIVEAFGAAQV